jgi:hypothetical protein
VRKGFVSSSALILAGRALLVGVAAAAVVTGFVVTRKRAPKPVASGAVYYVCPMHPAVTSAAPGECPICRMTLERQEAGKAGGTAAAAAAEPAALTFPHGIRLAGFDSVSRVKQYESAFDMRAWAWAESRQVGVALYPRDQAAILKPGEEGLFEPQSGPRGPLPHGIKVHLTDQAPQAWDDSTALVRFRLDDHAGAELEPKEIGSVKFALRLRNGLVVKESAIIQSPEGPYVLIASEDRRTFTKRPVQIGTTMYGYADVVGGAREDEYAVALHTFVLDTERRLGRRAAP